MSWFGEERAWKQSIGAGGHSSVSHCFKTLLESKSNKQNLALATACICIHIVTSLCQNRHQSRTFLINKGLFFYRMNNRTAISFNMLLSIIDPITLAGEAEKLLCNATRCTIGCCLQSEPIQAHHLCSWLLIGCIPKSADTEKVPMLACGQCCTLMHIKIY